MATKKEGRGTAKINPKTQEQLIKKLIDNFTSMQKVLTHLSVKFDALTDQLSKLLELFEISAKSLAEKKEGGMGKPENLVDDNFIKKLDEILDQNKTIARGMVLIGERLTELEEEEGVKEGAQDIGRDIFSPRRRPRPRHFPQY